MATDRARRLAARPPRGLINFHFTGNRIDAKRFPKLEAYFRRHIESPLLASILSVEKPFADQVPGLDTSVLA